MTYTLIIIKDYCLSGQGLLLSSCLRTVRGSNVILLILVILNLYSETSIYEPLYTKVLDFLYPSNSQGLHAP